MRPTRPVTAALVAALALAFTPAVTEAPAGYDHPDAEREIRFVESTGWFTSTSTRVGNLDHENGEWVTWTDTEPSDPAGGVTVATSYSGIREVVEDEGQDKGQFTAEGTHTGYLDSITLDLYYLDPYAGSLCDLNLAVDLTVDGIAVLDMDGLGGVVPVTTAPAGPSAADGHVARLKITDIFAQMDAFSSSGFDFVGDETTEHTIRVSVHMYPLCNEVVWRHGSSAAPSSIVLNRDPADPSVAEHTTFSVTNPPTG